MELEHRERFRSILNRIADKIPGIASIDTKVTDDQRVLLRFNDGAFADPFFAKQMSDSTLKVFAYLLLLEDPDPPPFICIEEPENGLYHKLLEPLAQEFRNHATGRKSAPQICVTTHQPYFVDALAPDEDSILEKWTDGFSAIARHFGWLIRAQSGRCWTATSKTVSVALGSCWPMRFTLAARLRSRKRAGRCRAK
ncbi:MAG: AAA family ATPase [Thiohalocapsa sp.]